MIKNPAIDIYKVNVQTHVHAPAMYFSRVVGR